MIMTTEIYRLSTPVRYWRGTPHTDSIESVDDIALSDVKPDDIIYDEILTGVEYQSTVLANSCVSIKDFGMSKKDTIRVVILNPNYD